MHANFLVNANLQIGNSTWLELHLAKAKVQFRSPFFHHKHSVLRSTLSCSPCFNIAVSSVLHYSAEAAQQCVSCSLTRDCFKATSPTLYCKGKCFKWLLRKNSPDEKPAVIKGCTSDTLFWRRTCIDDCYDTKREFGDGMYYTCIYCCTGDKCNPASQMKGGIILAAVSATLAERKQKKMEGER